MNGFMISMNDIPRSGSFFRKSLCNVTSFQKVIVQCDVICQHFLNISRTKQAKDSLAKYLISWENGHNINFENGKDIDTGSLRTRKTLPLESWHAALVANSDNNSRLLPKQYANLVSKQCNC